MSRSAARPSELSGSLVALLWLLRNSQLQAKFYRMPAKKGYIASSITSHEYAPYCSASAPTAARRVFVRKRGACQR